MAAQHSTGQAGRQAAAVSRGPTHGARVQQSAPFPFVAPAVWTLMERALTVDATACLCRTELQKPVPPSQGQPLSWNEADNGQQGLGNHA